MVLSTTRPNGLSSTLSTRSAASASVSLPPDLRDFAGPAASRETVSVKVAPPPRRGATVMSPPIARASCFTEDSPKPAPPKREAMVTLAWVKGRNSRLISAIVRPMPLSDIAKATPTLRLSFALPLPLPLAGCQGAAEIPTPPSSVNFTALSLQFPRTEIGGREQVADRENSSQGGAALMGKGGERRLDHVRLGGPGAALAHLAGRPGLLPRRSPGLLRSARYARFRRHSSPSKYPLS